MTAFNFADLFELMVDTVPDRLALVVGNTRRTYAQLEERTNRLAHHLADAGIGPGDHVGIYGYNSAAWVEAMFALYKVRAVPVNINYRYVEGELRYLFDNADLVGLVVERGFAPRVAAVRESLPQLRHVVVIDDGSGAELGGLDAVDYEAAVASGAAVRDFPERSNDDLHIIYTGGSTGMPKGVMWRQQDIFYALCGGIDAYTSARIEQPQELAQRAAQAASGTVMLAVAPLMHGAAQVSTIRALIAGDSICLVPRFDAEDVWRVVAREKVNVLGITGDAMGRPLADALERMISDLDLTALVSVSSSAAIFSPVVKEQFMRLLPDAVIVDSIGATETGMNGIKIAQPGERPRGGPATVDAAADSIVVDEDMRPLGPGSGVVGRLARTGNVPLGYYKDPEKTAATFVEADGVRYALAGDLARVEEDGQITLLGRGSVMINTGGEKVFPEEVEGVLKEHPDVFDALVVGVSDERWGERVTAIVQPRPGCSPTLDELTVHCRDHIAGYKIPKQLLVVDQVQRAPSGKPDYPWAKRYATEHAAAGTSA